MSNRTRDVRFFFYRSARAELVFQKNGQVILENVFSEEKRKGHTRGCLLRVVEYADRHGLTLRLKAQKYGSDPSSPSDRLLIDMYTDHGFVVDESYKNSTPTRMIRKPKRGVLTHQYEPYPRPL